MVSASSQSSRSCPSRYPRSCHNSKAFFEIRSRMPSGSLMACGDTAKGERIEGFIFPVCFCLVALVITHSLVKCALRETFLSESPDDGQVQPLGYAPR